jgi:ATP-dependent DNA helicase RecQ
VRDGERPLVQDATVDGRALDLLRDVFGHDAFRLGQREVIESILAKKPTLAVMPTGSGKSLCYQLPALAFEGTTVVVSPLIALIRDQVTALRAKGVRASSITSADGPSERQRTAVDLAEGRLSLLYVAPERFRADSFVQTFESRRIPLFVVDEAHCISEWGHDFRPDYARLGDVVERLAPERVACLTATATPRVQADILESLRLRGAEVIVTGFDRPNLELSVHKVARGEDKDVQVALALTRWLEGGGSGIVYVATRRASEELASTLRASGFSAAAYHAGLSPGERSRSQDDFQSDRTQVIVATSAFGMGVDKEDVRVVVHHHLPSSPEAYYQEVGRAGRDGLPAAGALIYSASDLRYAFMRLESSTPTYPIVEATLRTCARLARSSDPPRDLDRLSEALEPELGPSARTAAVALERSGDIGFDRGRLAVSSERPSLPAAAFERRATRERAKLSAMIGYADRAPCRRRYLVDYFGDRRRPDACGACDRCRGPAARALEGGRLEEAQMALSCIARMKGRFGRTRVIDVLLGKLAQETAQLSTLSTFGLLREWTKEEVSALIDGLLRAGLAEVTAEEYPKIRLTGAGAEALRTRAVIRIDTQLARWGDAVEAPLRGRRAKKPRAPAGEVDPMSAEDQDLFDRLRRWRSEQAHALAKPSFVVASDALLRAIASDRPADLDALAMVKGIGPRKLSAYGDRILEIVRGAAAVTDSSDG